MDDIANAALTFGIEGLIVGNTTISRPDILAVRLKPEKRWPFGRAAVRAFDQSVARDAGTDGFETRRSWAWAA